MSRYLLTRAAELDVEQILRDTAQKFGTAQKNLYKDIIKSGIETVAAQPDTIGSRRRDDLAPSLRSFHIALTGRRRRSASHSLYYVLHEAAPNESCVVILRVLLERMDPQRHLNLDAAFPLPPQSG